MEQTNAVTIESDLSIASPCSQDTSSLHDGQDDLSTSRIEVFQSHGNQLPLRKKTWGFI